MLSRRRFLDSHVRRVLRHYWRVAGARPRHVAIPVALTLLAAGLEGASFSLLVPLADAVSGGGFAFLADSRAFGWILALVPDGLLASPRRDLYLAIAVLGLVVLARGGRLLAALATSLYVHGRDERYYARVQERTFAQILGFGRQYFERQSLGRLDVELGWSRAVVDLLARAEEFLKNVLNVAAKVAVMVFISVPLSLALVVVFPAVLYLMRRISREIERLAGEEADVEVRSKSRVLDLLASVPLVKALSQEAGASAAYGSILAEARAVATRRRNLLALRWPLEEIFVLAAILAVQTVLMVLSGTFVPGDLARLAVFLLVVQQTLGDLKGFGRFEAAVAEMRPRLQALARLMSDEDKYMVRGGDRAFTGLERAVEVRGLSFSYEEGRPVLRDVSAEIRAGCFTAVVGESGAGKSTLSHLIGRFYDCPPGTIFLDGVDIRDFSLRTLYRQMAVVSQDVLLLNRTLRENLVYGLEEPPPDPVLLELLFELELGPFLAEHADPLGLPLGDRGVQLSGGQRQRVAVARTLLRDPEILILDEATSALDSAVERKVAEAIARRFRGRTLLVIAHRLSTLRRAEHILVLREGRLVEEGAWDELLALGGEFSRLHEAQFEGAPA